MAGILESVNSRTQLVGQNRLELLLFKLDGQQMYGINVFKVREVLPCPALTLVPKRNPVVRGIAHIRGGTISVMDLSLAIGKRELEDLARAFVIITEYNGRTQGFLVRSVERIVNLNWGAIHPPPKGAGRALEDVVRYHEAVFLWAAGAAPDPAAGLALARRAAGE